MFKVGDKVRIKRSAQQNWAEWCLEAKTITVVQLSPKFGVRFNDLTFDKHYEGYVARQPTSDDFELTLPLPPTQFSLKVDFTTTDIDEAITTARKLAVASNLNVSIEAAP